MALAPSKMEVNGENSIACNVTNLQRCIDDISAGLFLKFM